MVHVHVRSGICVGIDEVTMWVKMREWVQIQEHCGASASIHASLNLNLNSLLVTRKMTLFHQGVRMGEK